MCLAVLGSFTITCEVVPPLPVILADVISQKEWPSLIIPWGLPSKLVKLFRFFVESTQSCQEHIYDCRDGRKFTVTIYNYMVAAFRGLIVASLSEPHTSVTALRTHVYLCLLACLLGLTTYQKF